MRICLLTPRFLPAVDSIGFVVHHVAQNLANLGHDIVVVTLSGGSARGHTDVYDVKTVPKFVSWFSGRLAFVKEYLIALWLAVLWIRWHYHVLNVHTTYPGGVAAAALQRLVKVSTVITSHAVDIQVLPELGYGMRLRPGLEAKIKRGLEKADMVTAVGESVARDVSELCPTIANVHVVKNGVDGERFLTNPWNMRDKLGIGPEYKVILAVGHNRPKKGYLNLLQALNLLSQRRDDFKCVIVGRDMDGLVPVVQEMGLEHLLVFPGQFPRLGTNHLDPRALPPDELVSLYLESHVFVSPSFIEGFALVIPEAMMAGLPVVATNVPGNIDIVVDGENGLLVPVGDANALAMGLERVIGDDTLRQHLAQGAREMAAHYDWSEITKAYVSVYEAAIEKVREHV